MSRPTLLPGLPALRRNAHQVQLGSDPARAVILEFADPAAARVLDLLDGSRTEAALLRSGGPLGMSAEQVATVLDTLRRAGLLVPDHTLVPAQLPEPLRARLLPEAAALALRAVSQPPHNAPPAGPDRPPEPEPAMGPGRAPAAGLGRTPADILRRRAAARIVVNGLPRLAVGIATTLAGSGVGHLDLRLAGRVRAEDPLSGGLVPADVGRDRGPAGQDAILRAAPATQLSRLTAARTTFVVQVGATAPAELTALILGRRAVAHLCVALRDGVVLVGPLVPPAGTPCLNCVDLHRRDRDPAWPALAAQLATRPPAVHPCTVGTALAGIALAADEVLSYLDGGQPDTLAATIEVAAPGRQRRRSWSSHPECGCLGTRAHRIGAADEVQ